MFSALLLLFAVRAVWGHGALHFCDTRACFKWVDHIKQTTNWRHSWSRRQTHYKAEEEARTHIHRHIYTLTDKHTHANTDTQTHTNTHTHTHLWFCRLKRWESQESAFPCLFPCFLVWNRSVRWLLSTHMYLRLQWCGTHHSIWCVPQTARAVLLAFECMCVRAC